MQNRKQVLGRLASNIWFWNALQAVLCCVVWGSILMVCGCSSVGAT